MNNEKNDLIFAKVRNNAIIPTRDKENAGYDIYSCFDEDYIVINPHSTKLIPTGIASCVNEKYYLQVEERGSTGSRGIKKSAGVIDSGYRGEIFIAISNINNNPIIISKLERKLLPSEYSYKVIIYPYEKAIAQLIVHEIPKMNVKIIPYERLLDIPSKRKDGKLGSSNK